jgi:hypothetical protein
MRRRTAFLDILLAAVVGLHLVICLVHGAAHTGARVPLSSAANLFVLLVIVAGPPVGLIVWRWLDPRAGTWAIAATLGASLAFGVINHFVIAGADHVAHIAPSWRVMFGVTAVLLVITEAFGSGVAVWSAVQMRRSS